MLASRDAPAQSRLGDFIQNLERQEETNEASTASTATANWSQDPSGPASQVDSSDLSIMARQLMNELLEMEAPKPRPQSSSDANRSPNTSGENWNSFMDDCLIDIGDLDESMPEPSLALPPNEQQSGLLKPVLQPQRVAIPSGQLPVYRPPGMMKAQQQQQPMMKLPPQPRPMQIIKGQPNQGLSLLPELSLMDIETQLGNLEESPSSSAQDIVQSAFGSGSQQRPQQLVVSKQHEQVGNLLRKFTRLLGSLSVTYVMDILMISELFSYSRHVTASRSYCGTRFQAK
ncbi:hypothetical protein Ciccas_006158 [Cichlidogyrus casuarinus]|uniref:Uncharacterized protein n=1 Tax=Cichlidogyrus casuarinus TaxID=1844966 RepID=A0ABD2Q6Y3_9PLAT